MEIVVSAILLTFALFTLFLKNKILKNFFFLLTFLAIVIALTVSFNTKTVTETTSDISGSSTSVTYYEVPGKDALIYGFGILMIVMLVIVLLDIVFSAFEGV